MNYNINIGIPSKGRLRKDVLNIFKKNNYKNLLNTNLITQMNEIYKKKLLKFDYEL